MLNICILHDKEIVEIVSPGCLYMSVSVRVCACARLCMLTYIHVSGWEIVYWRLSGYVPTG